MEEDNWIVETRAMGAEAYEWKFDLISKYLRNNKLLDYIILLFIFKKTNKKRK